MTRLQHNHLDNSPERDWYDGDLTPESFQKLGYRVIDAIADYLRQVRDAPVFPGHPPEDVARVFEEPLPEEGQDRARILTEWTEKVLPHTTHIGSPRYFGFVMGSGTPMGILAEALAASVNTNAGGWKPAPAATEIERRTLAWLAELIGYDPACGGILVSGGTMATSPRSTRSSASPSALIAPPSMTSRRSSPNCGASATSSTRKRAARSATCFEGHPGGVSTRRGRA